MRPAYLLVLATSLVTSFAFAQEESEYITPKDKGQTSYVLRRLPVGIAQMPVEAIYRLNRLLKINRWDQMIDKKEVQTILNQTKDLRVPVVGSTFPFQNFSEDFEGIVDRDFGVCSGYATLQRNFNILMHFDPKNTHKAIVPDKNKNIIAYYDYYTDLIKTAARFRPVIIPHFSNLTELFSDPYFQVIAKKEIVKMWAKNNTSIQGIEQFSKANGQFPKKKWEKLYQNLKERLDAGYNPIIYASFNPTDHIKYNIHVIQVMKVSQYRKDGSFEIYIWDDGVLSEFFGDFTPEKLVKVITFRPNGSIWWLESEAYLNLPFSNPNDPKMKELGEKELIDETLWINLLPNDDRVMAKVMKRKMKWCASKKEFNKYCM
jgi:hypothetical protein